MEATLKTIKLSGSLAKLFGRSHRLAVANAAEAVRALCATRPGFEKYMMESKDNGIVFAVFVGRENICHDQLNNPTGEDVIRLVPVITGSKKQGLLQTIVGAVLVAAGFVVGYFFGWTGVGWAVGKYMIGAGISMMVGGIVQMLTPVPKNQAKKDDDRRSYIFNGAVNVQAQGNCVPLLYGEMIVGSVVVSAGISSQDNYVVPRSSGDYGPVEYRDGGSMMGDVIARAKNESL